MSQRLPKHPSLFPHTFTYPPLKSSRFLKFSKQFFIQLTGFTQHQVFRYKLEDMPSTLSLERETASEGVTASVISAVLWGRTQVGHSHRTWEWKGETKVEEVE